ncbi:DUF881 domain-containing protein [Fictibacillus macauensis]|uniref:DUF881 domain-containing protein n=1 Tax=Fictibacillus macauensis TaxID=245160 RepID=UPI0013894769|nr:DUF881 domain-containing protein [Fictibacillus macauensis]
MKKRKTIVLSGAALIVGMMLAIQYNTSNNPITRDTRDIWQVRTSLEKEKQKQQELNAEIKKYEALLDDYSQSKKIKSVQAVERALKDAKKDAGLTSVSGQGIFITIEPFSSGEAPKVNPENVRKLMNELNRYKAKNVSISGQRIISISPIREVNGQTYVNNEPIASFPITLKVLTDEPAQLKEKILSSQAAEAFVKQDLLIDAREVQKLTLPAYHGPIPVKYMKQVKEDS